MYLDNECSDSGEMYAMKLANFVEKCLKNERAASIWTSTLQRTILTVNPIVGFPKIQWCAFDKINAGVCDGMAYEEMKKTCLRNISVLSDCVSLSRKNDKLRYRYPSGNLIWMLSKALCRLEPVIIEPERQWAHIMVISHQAVLRALYSYFAHRPLKEIPHIEDNFC